MNNVKIYFVSYDQHPDFKLHKSFSRDNSLIFINRLSKNLDEIKFCAKYKTITIPQVLVLHKNTIKKRYEFWLSEEAINEIKKGNYFLTGLDNVFYNNEER